MAPRGRLAAVTTAVLLVAALLLVAVSDARAGELQTLTAATTEVEASWSVKSVWSAAASVLDSLLGGSAEDADEVEIDDAALACPNNCSGHGACGGTGICRCTYGWGGADCSIVDYPLSSGTNMSGTTDGGEWTYFHVNTPTTAYTMTWTLQDTNVLGDCDLYLEFNDYPTLSNYYWRDISLDANVTVSIPRGSGNAGTWWAGIYGFFRCAWTVSVTVSAGACPGGCSGNGVCLTNTTCQCNVGWGGSDCSLRDQQLQLGVSYGPVAVGNGTRFVYGHLSGVPANTALTFWVQRVSPSDGFVNSYLRLGSYPSGWQWDAYNSSFTQLQTIAVPSSQAGTYYLGVSPALSSGSNFYFGVNATSSQPVVCASNCSGASHGSCGAVAGVNCTCTSSAFSGANCEYMTTPLPEGQVVTGTAMTTYWNYYQIAPFSGYPAVVTVTQDATVNPAGSDCDLYIRQAGYPTLFHYDLYDLSTSGNFSLTIPNPGSATWYLGVFGWQSCAYSLSWQTAACSPASCSFHGQCQYDYCVCDPGYGGSDCSQTSAALPIGQPVNGTAYQNAWSFFTYQPPQPTTSVVVSLKETQSVGLIWLFVNLDGFPSTLDADYDDKQHGSALHQVRVDFDNQAFNGTLYIGVYGSPFLVDSQGEPWQLVAWNPPFL